MAVILVTIFLIAFTPAYAMLITGLNSLSSESRSEEVFSSKVGDRGPDGKSRNTRSVSR